MRFDAASGADFSVGRFLHCRDQVLAEEGSVRAREPEAHRPTHSPSNAEIPPTQRPCAPNRTHPQLCLATPFKWAAGPPSGANRMGRKRRAQTQATAGRKNQGNKGGGRGCPSRIKSPATTRGRTTQP
ncbi:hypothetical protein OF83DRAFT_511998 [Amylostereum chailletii]|nr:hypothetical protein OF83DRAFT_511998 [Amylostereum chailletii]